MKMNSLSKKIALSVLMIALLIASIAGMATMRTFAEFDITNAEPYMVKGACVRVPDAKYAEGGLGFVMALSKDDYEGITENIGTTYSDVKFGIFIAPAYYNAKYALNEESNINGASAKYGWLTAEEKASGTAYEDSVAGLKGLYQIINTESNEMVEGEDDLGNDVYVFKGSVVNMLNDNMLTDYTCAGYIRYTDTLGTHYIFATSNDNTRSMTYVAQLAIQAGEEYQDVLKNTYVTPFADTDTQYTVNYFIKNSNGEYVKDNDKSGSLNAKIGSTVNIQPEEISGYSVVEREDSKTSGIVYANGKSVFNVYYRDKSILFDGTEKSHGFSNASGAGEVNIKLVDSPEIAGDKSVLIEDTGTNVNSMAWTPALFKRTALSDITEYNVINFKMYADNAVAFFPYQSTNTFSGTLTANSWVTYSIDISKIKSTCNVDYLRFWFGSAGYKVYISEVYLSNKSEKSDGLITDFESVNIPATDSINLSGATKNNATTAIVPDPTNSGHGNVYKWSAGSDNGSDNANATWSNMSEYVQQAIADGYDYLTVDLYKGNSDKQTSHGTAVNIDKYSFDIPSGYKWYTVSVPLNKQGTSNMMWMQSGGDYILFDNFRFTKMNPVLFDGEINNISINFSGTVSVEEDPTNQGHGKVYSLSHTGSASKEGEIIPGLKNLIEEAMNCGYTKLSIDAYYTSSNCAITIFGKSFKPALQNSWQTTEWNLAELDLDATANNVKGQFWLASAGAIYLDNIHFIKSYNPIVFDGEINKAPISSDKGATISVKDDPTGGNHGKVYSFSHTSACFGDDTKFNGLSDLITEAKSLGYTKLSVEAYRTTSDAAITILGGVFKPSEQNAWQTIEVNLDSLTGNNLLWINGAGSIYLDNIKFVK